MITILLGEDHPLVRRGIVGYLSTQLDLSVVTEAGEGAEAVRLAREHRPDVAVIDLQLPRIDGVETICRLTRDCPGTRVVVLTSHEGDADIFPTIHAGALSGLTERELEVLRLTDRTQAAVHAWRHGVLRRETES